MADRKPVFGTFSSGIPFARIGNGPKSLLLLLGGPGNALPGGMGLRALAGRFLDSAQDYTVHLVTRKSDLPAGYTTRQMSDDYAELIRRELGGRVDLLVGMSYGGLIAQHFAADHANLAGHIVIAMATHQLTKAGGELDMRYAELLSQGKRRAAMASYAEVFSASKIVRPVMRTAMWLLAPALLPPGSETFRRDVLVEAQAEVGHDGEACLGRIRVPVLVVVGENDPFFTPESAQEMARRLPLATVRTYPGKGHDILNERLFAEDVAAFVAGRPLREAVKVGR